MKKTFRFYLTALFVMLSITPASNALAFSDISNTYPHREAIDYLYSHGIINGYSDGTYRPFNTLNRAEFAKISMLAIFKNQSFQGENCFNDVHQEWFAKFVCAAKTSHIISGYPDFYYRPGKNINLAEALKILLEAKKVPLTQTNGEWFYKYFIAANQLGAFNKIESKSPNHDINRGEMAQLIYNLEKNQGGIQYNPVPVPISAPTPTPVPVLTPAPVPIQTPTPSPTPTPPLAQDPRFNGLKDQIAAILQNRNVPGASIAIIENNKIVWAEGIGTVEVGSGIPVTTDTLFQAASISKPLTALATLRLVEQGKLPLDAIVDPYLKTTKIPGSDKITLRQLLSHSAGVNIHGFIGYKPGSPIPTLQQILLGQPPANTPAIKVIGPQGTYMYSGGGYMVVQQILMDNHGKTFPDLMSELVLTPLEMNHSTYLQPLSGNLLSLASSGHDVNSKVIAGKWTVLPEMAAAGLWTTPSDLAKFVIAIQKAHAGQDNTLLSKAMADDMLTMQTPNGIGLGLFVQGDTNSGTLFHGGVNNGYKNSLTGSKLPGKGLIVMTNSNNGNAAFNDIGNAINAALAKK